MNILLFGAPGAGKGTQSSLLVENLGMVQISTGDLFRAAIKNKTQLGVEAQSYMDKGNLVPDSIVIGMVDEVLNSLNGKSFILDGFPRTVPQAEALGQILSKNKLFLDKAIFLEVPTRDLMGRLTGRRVCKGCGAVFHIQSQPSKVEGVCDYCSGELYQRNDDKEDVIGTRLMNYEKSTSPLKKFYSDLGLYVEIDGRRSSRDVFESIKQIVTQ